MIRDACLWQCVKRCAARCPSRPVVLVVPMAGTAVRSWRRLLATATDGGPPAWQPRKPAAATLGKDLRSLVKLMVF